MRVSVSVSVRVSVRVRVRVRVRVWVKDRARVTCRRDSETTALAPFRSLYSAHLVRGRGRVGVGVG